MVIIVLGLLVHICGQVQTLTTADLQVFCLDINLVGIQRLGLGLLLALVFHDTLFHFGSAK